MSLLFLLRVLGGATLEKQKGQTSFHNNLHVRVSTSYSQHGPGAAWPGARLSCFTTEGGGGGSHWSEPVSFSWGGGKSLVRACELQFVTFNMRLWQKNKICLWMKKQFVLETFSLVRSGSRCFKDSFKNSWERFLNDLLDLAADVYSIKRLLGLFSFKSVSLTDCKYEDTPHTRSVVSLVSNHSAETQL